MKRTANECKVKLMPLQTRKKEKTIFHGTWHNSPLHANCHRAPPQKCPGTIKLSPFCKWPKHETTFHPLQFHQDTYLTKQKYPNSCFIMPCKYTYHNRPDVCFRHLHFLVSIVFEHLWLDEEKNIIQPSHQNSNFVTIFSGSFFLIMLSPNEHCKTMLLATT